MDTRATLRIPVVILHFLLVKLATPVSNIYQSIYWDPWNPLFACAVPTIHVHIGDTINFLCPSDKFHFFAQSSHVHMIYENLYFLGAGELARDNYTACNATGNRRLLYCDNGEHTPKLYTISFRTIQTSADSLKFEPGETYYLIGTGFRKTVNLGQEVGGSCKDAGEEGQNKLRMRIHVCTDKQVENGNCRICKSAGCYEKCGDDTTSTSELHGGRESRDLNVYLISLILVSCLCLILIAVLLLMKCKAENFECNFKFDLNFTHRRQNRAGCEGGIAEANPAACQLVKTKEKTSLDIRLNLHERVDGPVEQGIQNDSYRCSVRQPADRSVIVVDAVRGGQ